MPHKNAQWGKKSLKIFLSVLVLAVAIIAVLFLSNVNYADAGDSKVSKNPVETGYNYEVYKVDNGFQKKVFFNGINMPCTQGSTQLCPYEEVTNFTISADGMEIRWYNKVVKIDFYDKTGDTKELIKNKDAKTKADKALTSEIKKGRGIYYYTHTSSKEEKTKPEKFGYQISTENVTCKADKNTLICDEQLLDFNQAIEEQGLTVEMSKDYIEFSGSDLSYIDPALTLNFGASGQGTYLQAWEAGSYTTDPVPPNSSNPPQGTETDVTAQAGFDSDEGTYRAKSINAKLQGYHRFKLNTTRAVESDVTYISFKWNGKVSNSAVKAYPYIWNATGNVWFQCGAFTQSTADVDLTCDSSSISTADMIDASGYVTFMIYANNSDQSLARSFSSDYLEVVFNYDDLMINAPTEGQATSLSTTLNTSQTSYNNTIWYTFDSGAHNYTLCTQSNECQGTIYFPKAGAYALTVYANKSTGDTTSRTKNLLVGQTTLDMTYNSPYENVGMFAWTCDSDGSNPPAEGGQVPTCDGTLTDQTANSALDADDSSYISLSGGRQWFSLYANLTPYLSSTNDIVSMNWTFITNYHNNGNGIGYLWNESANAYLTMFTMTYSDGYYTYYYAPSKASLTNLVSYVVLQSSATSSAHFLTDYAKMQLIYYPASTFNVITPTSGTQTSNTLTIPLVVGHNDTGSVWYSFNGGIINHTACSSGNPICDVDINFPRFGSYTLTVYGNDSTGAVSSSTITNLGFSNTTSTSTMNINATHDVYATNDYGYDYEALVKWDMTPLAGLAVSNATAVFYNHQSNYQADRTINVSHITNQTWTEDGVGLGAVAGACSQYNAFTRDATMISSFNNTANTANVWRSFDVGNLVLQSRTLGEDYFSIMFRQAVLTSFSCAYATSGALGVVESHDEIRFGDKSGGAGTSMLYFRPHDNSTHYPYLVVTYVPNVAPTATLISPADASSDASTSRTFQFNVSDDNEYVLNASVYIDDVLNSTLTNIPTDTTESIVVNGIASGAHTWFIRTYDTNGVSADSSEWSFTVGVASAHYTVNLTDSMSVTSGTGKKDVYGRKPNQSVTSSISTNPDADFFKGLTQTFTASSLTLRIEKMKRAVSGLFSVNSLVGRLYKALRTPAQALSFSPLTDPTAYMTLKISQSVSASPLLSDIFGAKRGVSDSASITDSSGRGFLGKRNPSAIITTSSLVDPTAYMKLKVSQSISASPLLSWMFGAKRTSGVTITTGSATDPTLFASRANPASINILSGVDFTGYFKKGLSTSFIFSSSTDRKLLDFTTVTDSFSVSSLTSKLSVFKRGVAQTFSITEYTSRTAKLFRSFIDNILVILGMDTKTTVSSQEYTVDVSDSISISPISRALGNFMRGIYNIFGITDNIDNLLRYLRSNILGITTGTATDPTAYMTKTSGQGLVLTGDVLQDYFAWRNANNIITIGAGSDPTYKGLRLSTNQIIFSTSAGRAPVFFRILSIVIDEDDFIRLFKNMLRMQSDGITITDDATSRMYIIRNPTDSASVSAFTNRFLWSLRHPLQGLLVDDDLYRNYYAKRSIYEPSTFTIIVDRVSSMSRNPLQIIGVDGLTGRLAFLFKGLGQDVIIDDGQDPYTKIFRYSDDTIDMEIGVLRIWNNVRLVFDNVIIQGVVDRTSFFFRIISGQVSVIEFIQEPSGLSFYFVNVADNININTISGRLVDMWKIFSNPFSINADTTRTRNVDRDVSQSFSINNVVQRSASILRGIIDILQWIVSGGHRHIPITPPTNGTTTNPTGGDGRVPTESEIQIGHELEDHQKAQRAMLSLKIMLWSICSLLLLIVVLSTDIARRRAKLGVWSQVALVFLAGLILTVAGFFMHLYINDHITIHDGYSTLVYWGCSAIALLLLVLGVIATDVMRRKKIISGWSQFLITLFLGLVIFWSCFYGKEWILGMPVFLNIWVLVGLGVGLLITFFAFIWDIAKRF